MKVNSLFGVNDLQENLGDLKKLFSEFILLFCNVVQSFLH